MRRISIGGAVLVGTIGVLLVSAHPSTQRRNQRFDIQTVNGREAVAREVLVKFRRTLQVGELDQIRSQSDSGTIESIGRAGLRRLRSKSLDVAKLVALLAHHPDVAYAEPNYIVHAFAQPNDPNFPQLWGLENIGQAVNSGLPGAPGSDIHAVDVWDLSVGSITNVVAVVDTGIDYTHPDLAANVWSAPSAFTVTIDGLPITCPAGSHGFNALARSCDPMDDHNHGTHAAGTIGAVGNNGEGVVGVNWTTRLMGLKFLDESGSGTVAGAINAIEFAIQAKQAFAATGGANVRVLSNSWGGPDFSQALLDEVNAANGHDMLFVAAAGNNGLSNDIFPIYPASFNAPNVVAVAATTNTDSRAFFSNYGASSVHLGAPGVDILSTIVGGTYGFMSGTSMATPQVSGAAALVLSRCDLDTAGLKNTLLGSVEPVPALASLTMTGGRLDVNSAIHACIGPPDAPSGLTALAGDARVTLAWSAATGATSYNVKRSLTAGGPYASVASSVNGTSYEDVSVLNGTTYYYVVSAVNTLGESGDSNEASATPKARPDVVVSSLVAPSTAGPGTTIVVSEATTNQGAGMADPSTTKLYLSANYVLDANDTLLGAHSVPVLQSGETSSTSLSLDIPSGLTPAAYILIAKADADNVLAETLETNNLRFRPVQIGSDLVISSLTVPASAAPGAAISVTDTVKNQGGGAASASTTRFYLSANAILDATDVLLAGARAVPGLSAGASSSGAATLTIPAATAVGSYYLFAKADADNAVVETQETNNSTPRSIQIGGDLVVSGLTAPTSAGPGSAIMVSETTRNQGTASVAASVTRFFLSVNALLDAGDELLAGGHTVPALSAGAGSFGSTSLTIPPATAVGTFYLFAKADADNVVSETQEGNNAALRVIQIGGDLVVSALTVPAKAAAGSAILVTDTTANRGAGPTAASVTQFYLSSDFTLNAADVLLDGSRMVPALAAGSSSVGSTMVTIPGGLATATYYVFAKADADNAVGETQEGNNTASRTIAIGPDLVVSSVSAPFSAPAGSTVTIGDTVTNQGTDPAGPSTTRFYLSTNLLLDASDVPLTGSRAVPSLAGAVSSAGSTPATIPAGVASGSYFLLVKADADAAVTETQEGNNVSIRALTITAAP